MSRLFFAAPFDDDYKDFETDRRIAQELEDREYMKKHGLNDDELFSDDGDEAQTTGERVVSEETSNKKDQDDLAREEEAEDDPTDYSKTRRIRVRPAQADQLAMQIARGEMELGPMPKLPRIVNARLHCDELAGKENLDDDSKADNGKLTSDKKLDADDGASGKTVHDKSANKEEAPDNAAGEKAPSEQDAAEKDSQARRRRRRRVSQTRDRFRLTSRRSLRRKSRSASRRASGASICCLVSRRRSRRRFSSVLIWSLRRSMPRPRWPKQSPKATARRRLAHVDQSSSDDENFWLEPRE